MSARLADSRMVRKFLRMVHEGKRPTILPTAERPLTHIDPNRVDVVAGIVQDVLEEHMHLGTSGRYLTDYGVSPSDLADMVLARIAPPGETDGGAA